jgi:acyl-CoA thioesterase-2
VTVVQDDQTIFALSASFRVPGADDLSDDVFIGPELRTDVPEPADSKHLDVEPEIALEVRMCVNPSRTQYFPTLFWARPQGLGGTARLDHAAALVYLSDYSAGLPRHNGKWTLGPSLDHAIWLHRPFIWDDWVLVELSPGVAAQGRGSYTGTISDRRGLVVASFAQEMVYFTAR